MKSKQSITKAMIPTVAKTTVVFAGSALLGVACMRTYDRVNR